MTKKRNITEWLELLTSYVAALGVLFFLYPAAAYVGSGAAAAYWSWAPAWGLFALCVGLIWFMRGMKKHAPADLERMVMKGRM